MTASWNLYYNYITIGYRKSAPFRADGQLMLPAARRGALFLSQGILTWVPLGEDIRLVIFSVVFLFAIFAAVHFFFRISQNKYML